MAEQILIARWPQHPSRHPARTPRSLRNAALFAAAFVIAGCATYQGATPPVEDRAPMPPPGPPATAPVPPTATTQSDLPPPVTQPDATHAEATRRDPATLSLLAQSDQALAAGNPAAAIAFVERALRIRGNDVELWLRLAELKLAAGDPHAAENIAERAIALAGSRIDWQRRGWLIIADSREAQGDREEAARIRFEWRAYRG